MADLRADILNASAAADRLHKRFDTKKRADTGEGRIDVFDMLVENDIPIMFQRLKNLLGAFLNEDGSKGVIVTTERPLSVQRFTAAHELGHAVLGHEPSADPEGILFRYPVASREVGEYSRQEIQANVFASQLLSPPWLIAKHMKRQGWTNAEMSRSEVVYQLSLRLGISYLATCHALLRNKVIDEGKCEVLQEVTPKAIKKTLASPHTPADWRRDVWVVTERDDGVSMEGSRSDMIVLRVKEHSGSGYLWQFDDFGTAGLAVVHDDLEDDSDNDFYGGIVFRTVIAAAKEDDLVEGHVFLRETRPWQTKGEPLQSIKLDLDFFGPVDAGLHRSQRKALLGAS